jgi:alpha-beta hydrolase superfamily lysophospholipase
MTLSVQIKSVRKLLIVLSLLAAFGIVMASSPERKIMLREKMIGGVRRWRFVLLVVGLVVVIGFSLLTPWNIANLTSDPHPVSSYGEAVQRIETIQAQEASGFNPVCQLQFMTHGQKVERAIVLVHGYSTCPEQFHSLGTAFYDLGYNVLIAPLPHHGLADRMTSEQAQLTADELAAYADVVMDIAKGLGDHITMVGLSGGGVTTAWAAQLRSDLDLAVIIAPGFGFHQIPTRLTVPVMNLYSVLPNSFQWFDPALKEAGVPAYAYPRYSTYALREILRLGFATQAQARQTAPAARSILVVTNANDKSVNNALTEVVAGYWRDQGANLRTYEFGAELQLGHDLIDPTQPDARTDIVYPKLIELTTE